MPRRLGLDPGSAEALEDYEKARRFDTVAMGAVTDGLNRLFSNDATPLRLARDLGLGLVDRMPGLKRFFIREAAGCRSPPRLLRVRRCRLSALRVVPSVRAPGRGWAAEKGRGVVGPPDPRRRGGRRLGWAYRWRRASSGSMIGMPSRIG